MSTRFIPNNSEEEAAYKAGLREGSETLRDKFIAAAVIGLLFRQDGAVGVAKERGCEAKQVIADAAIAVADAVLEARLK